MQLDRVGLLLLVLLNLRVCLSFPSSPGDGCSDYSIEHAVSATLATDVASLRRAIGDPTAVPQLLFFYLFGQQFWGSDPVGDNIHTVHFKSGGHAVLEVC